MERKTQKSASPPPPEVTVSQAIEKLEHEWMKAYVARDIPFLERFLSDDYTGGYPNGTVLTKRSEIEAVRSGTVSLSAIQPLDMKVRAYGDAAVATGRSAIHATVNGQKVEGEFRFIDVWAHHDGAWQAVASQVTRIIHP